MKYLQMNETHILQIAQLEQLCFSAPWSENSVRGELTNQLSLWIVCMDGDVLTGYVGSQSVMGEADMMNLAVNPKYRRQGIGKGLVQALIEQLNENAVSSLTLEVRASNTPAISLYHSLGFNQAGRRPNYYASPREDALILRKEWNK